MRFILALFWLVWLVWLASVPLAQAQVTDSQPVTGEAFDARYFANGIAGNYGLIVLGGSGGGRADELAATIAELGHHVLSLAYFDRSGSETVPQTLELIPLEYFEAPKRWLMNQPGTRDDGVILFGMSKGAELALLLATVDADYRGVIALAPSHVVWQGNPADLADIMSSPSSWSWQGQGLPFVPYISIEERDRLGFSNRHAASLTNRDAVSRARIPVQNIQGPVLLLSGEADAMWPAARMGEAICAAMRGSGSGSCRHESYPGGEHLLDSFRAELHEEIASFLERFTTAMPR